MFDKLFIDFSSSSGCQNYVRFIFNVGEVLLGWIFLCLVWWHVSVILSGDWDRESLWVNSSLGLPSKTSLSYRARPCLNKGCGQGREGPCAVKSWAPVFLIAIEKIGLRFKREWLTYTTPDPLGSGVSKATEGPSPRPRLFSSSSQSSQVPKTTCSRDTKLSLLFRWLFSIHVHTWHGTCVGISSLLPPLPVSQ